jgi:hypothetical protein
MGVVKWSGDVVSPCGGVPANLDVALVNGSLTGFSMQPTELTVSHTPTKWGLQVSRQE